MTKLLPITAIALMCTTGVAMAAEDPSGRPTQILDESKCQEAWNAAGPENGSLSEANATPYVLNFERLDTSNDRKISQDEWTAGCNKGWVSADARPVSPLNTKAGNETEQNDMADDHKNKKSQNMNDENKSKY